MKTIFLEIMTCQNENKIPKIDPHKINQLKKFQRIFYQ